MQLAYTSCCQQYLLPGFAFLEHWVPFFVVAWQRPDCAARAAGAVFGKTALAVAGVFVLALSTGGLQSLQGWYFAAASLSVVAILLARSELQDPVWYFVPVLVT